MTAERHPLPRVRGGESGAVCSKSLTSSTCSATSACARASTPPGQIDAAWNAPVEADFNGWLKENIDKLPVAREQAEEILKGRQR